MTGVGPVDCPYRNRLLPHTITAMVVEGSRLKGKDDPEMELRVSSCLPTCIKLQFSSLHLVNSSQRQHLGSGGERMRSSRSSLIRRGVWRQPTGDLTLPTHKNKTNEQTKNQHKRNICVRYDVRLQTHIQEAETGVNYIGSSKATTIKTNLKNKSFKEKYSWTWWLRSLIQSLEGLKQKDCPKFKASLALVSKYPLLKVFLFMWHSTQQQQ